MNVVINKMMDEEPALAFNVNKIPLANQPRLTDTTKLFIMGERPNCSNMFYVALKSGWTTIQRSSGCSPEVAHPVIRLFLWRGIGAAERSWSMHGNCCSVWMGLSVHRSVLLSVRFCWLSIIGTMLHDAFAHCYPKTMPIQRHTKMAKWSPTSCQVY